MTSQVLSQLTIQLMNFLILTFLFEKTSSSIATSFLWIAYALPSILVGPIASAAIDFTDKRKVLIITNLLQALLIFVYAISHQNSTFLLYTVVVFYSLINQFYVPAELASLPVVVKEKFLSQANGLFFITQQVALIVGFGVASSFYTYLKFETTLVICSFFLLIAAIATTLLPRMGYDKRKGDGFETNFFAFFKKIFDGYELIRKDRYVLAPFLLLISLQVIVTVIAINAPVIAREIFDIPIHLAGIILVVPAGLGSAFAAFGIPKLLRKQRKITIVSNFLFLLILTFFMLVFVLPLVPIVIRLILGMITLFTAGFAFVGILIPTQTFLQEKTPDDYRGRVFGNFWFLVTIATIFPVIFSGTLTEIFGIKILLFVLAISLAGIYVFIRNRGETFLQNSLK